jgi:CRP/FNR family transcriptional regulator
MERNPASAQALDEVTLFVLPQHYLHHLEQQSSLFSLALLRIYSQRLDHLARLIEGLGAWTAADRINHCLLTYADQTESGHVVRLTHDKLATLSGTVREVVTRHLAHLEKVGAVHIEPGQITIVDRSTLTLPCALGNEEATVE